MAARKADALDRALENTVTEWGSSRWAAWRKCPRLHHLSYQVGIERLYAGDEFAPSDAEGRPVYFAVGSLCHGILRYIQEGAMLGEARDWRDVLHEADRRGALPEALDEAQRLMSFYWLHWGEANGGWGEESVILEVEQHLQTAEGFSVLPHTGRADTVLEICGSVVIVDTKTRGRSLPKDLESYRRALATRPQFLSLSAMYQDARGLEEPPAVMVNAICKLKLPTFGRVIVPITQSAVDGWRRDHKAAALRMQRDIDTAAACADAGLSGDLDAVAPRNLDNCAPEVGQPCVMFDHCHGSDATRELHYRTREAA